MDGKVKFEEENSLHLSRYSSSAEQNKKSFFIKILLRSGLVKESKDANKVLIIIAFILVIISIITFTKNFFSNNQVGVEDYSDLPQNFIPYN